jgi:nucleoside-diphosphate-sugar epimerase/glyoxylase-like metal-dependent hydrolase (beta-lactamase superfamily II)
MVDARLIDEVRGAIEGGPHRVLVTGATGFLGSHVARALAEAGASVTAVGRNPYATSRIVHPLIRFVRVDLAKSPSLSELVQSHDLVIHCAAMSKPWGKRSEFMAANVEGTRCVARACSEVKRRLLHVSSTSIFFDFADREGIRDDDPLPDRPCCHYAESKRSAEAVVKEYVDRGLDAIVVRARAIFGPGDAAIFPRILHAARIGRLRQIGNGANRIDLTYVDNMVLAIVLAAVRGKAGMVATLTNREAVLLWPAIREALAAAGMSAGLRRIPYGVAYAAAFAMEKLHLLLRRPGEPAITRYGVAILSKTQTFDTHAASEAIGYRPIVSVSEGLRRTNEALAARRSGHAETVVRCRLFTTGFTQASSHLADTAEPRRITTYHASFALIEHPLHGVILFDTGYSMRFFEETKRWPASLYARLAPAYTHEQLSAVNVLRRLGIDAADVRRVIVSHLHADHIGGLRDFPRADFICGPGAIDDVRGRGAIARVRRAFLPSLLPDDFSTRAFQLDQFADPGIGPFDHTHDLFGDGSIRLVRLPGHARGQIGALLQTGCASRTFLVADAAYHSASIARASMPHGATSLFIDSRRELARTLDHLRKLHSECADLEVVPTHCPEVALRCGFDEQVARVVPALVDRLEQTGRRSAR